MNPTVKLLSWTQNPLETLYACWEASRNNDPVPSPEDLARQRRSHPGCDFDIRQLFPKIIDAGIPVAENIHFCFLLEGVSIALREQLVRHRIGQKHGERLGMDIVPNLADSTWWAQSMRILDMGTFATDEAFLIPESADDTFMPPSSEEIRSDRVDPKLTTRRDYYKKQMAWCQAAYRRMVAAGMPMEDARNIIPLAACHRLTWSINLAALKHVIGKRGCWILQLGMWEPIIKGMVEELATKIDPAFRGLIAPPCIRGDKFEGCKFKLDNERRIAGEDEIPPCPLYLHNHEEEARALVNIRIVNNPMGAQPTAWQPQFSRQLGGEAWGCDANSVGGREEASCRESRMQSMCSAYRGLWGRDPATGVQLPQESGGSTPALLPEDRPNALAEPTVTRGSVPRVPE